MVETLGNKSNKKLVGMWCASVCVFCWKQKRKLSKLIFLVLPAKKRRSLSVVNLSLGAAKRRKKPRWRRKTRENTFHKKQCSETQFRTHIPSGVDSAWHCVHSLALNCQQYWSNIFHSVRYDDSELTSTKRTGDVGLEPGGETYRVKHVLALGHLCEHGNHSF